MPRPFPTPLAGLLLDLDGTLLDSEPLHFEAARRILQEEGVAARVEDFLPYVGWADLPFWGELRRRHGLRAEPAELMRRRSAAYLALLHETMVEPLPGVRDLLAWAAAARLPVAVASNSTRPLIEGALRACGLHAAIPVWVSGADDVPRCKPAPDVYLAAAAALGLSAAACVALEDSPTGARAAAASGAFTIAVPCPSHPAPLDRFEAADWIAGDALQVLDFLRARGAPPSSAASTTSAKRST